MRHIFILGALLLLAGLGFSKQGFLRTQVDAAAPKSRSQAVADIFFVAVLAALATGLFELAGLVVAQQIRGRLAFWSLDAAWLTPVVYLLIFMVPALVLAAIAWFWSRVASTHVLAFVFGTLAFGSMSLSLARVHKAASAILALGLAVRVTTWAGAHPQRFRGLARRVAPGLALVVCLIAFHNLGADRRERRAIEALPSTAPATPNVLLLILDTVRSSSLSLYGYGRPTTPNLERLALESVVYDRAIATAPWTLPTHVSLLTGAYPHATTAGFRIPMDDGHRTLAEHFRDQGYATGASVANHHYASAETGLAKGFIHYEGYMGAGEPLLSHAWLGNTAALQRLSSARSVGDVFAGLAALGPSKPDKRFNRRRDAPEINASLFDWLDTIGERPFFAMLNYFDAHSPYEPPEPYRTRFELTEQEMPDLAPEIRAELGNYEGAIASLDAQLGLLIDALEARGLLENTIVVITSDHGEQFGEHGGSGHGNTLFTEVLHVPLMIRFPAGLPSDRRVSEFVSLRDVPHTLAGLATPDVPNPFPGVPLPGLEPSRGMTASGPGAASRPVLSELTVGPGGAARTLGPANPSERKSVIDGRYHYIWGRLDDQLLQRVYDLETDFGEQNDLIDTPLGREVAGRLHQALLDLLPGDAETETESTAATGDAPSGSPRP